MKIVNKTVVVTGSSSGIGEAIAILFAKQGAKVVVNSRNNTVGGNNVLKEIADIGVRAIYVQADVSTEKGANKLITNAVKSFGTVDILVNNAGMATPNNIDDIKSWEMQLKNIFLSCVMSTAEFLKVETKSQRKIINISSIYSLQHSGNIDYMAYSAAKAAMNSFTVNLAKKMGNQVLVNAVAPGYTFTPQWGKDADKFSADMKKHTIIGRFINVEEIARMVLFVAQNDALTGQIITVDGGATLNNMF